jgi:hypothetical protein
MVATIEPGAPKTPLETLDLALGRRFALKYAGVAGVLFALYCFPYAYVGISERPFEVYLGGYARLVGSVLSLLGENVHVSGSRIDFQPAVGGAGRNYGWPSIEGTLCNTCNNSCGTVNCMNPSFIPPVHEVDANVGQAIIGGYVYRGSAMPSFRGCYVFGDYSSGQIWAINPASPSVRALLKRLSAVTTFGEDSNGELYVGTLSGTVFRLAPTAPVASVPASGGWAGVGLAALLAAFGLVRRRRALA